MSDITTAAIAFISASISTGATLAGVHLTNRNNNKRLKLQLAHERIEKEKKLYLERAEELYVLAAHWLDGLAHHYLSLSMVMQGKFTYEQHINSFIEREKDSKKDIKRLSMMIDIYFSNIKSAYLEVLDARSVLNKISKEYIKSYEMGEVDGTRYLQSYVKAQKLIEQRGEALKEQIVKCAKKA